MSTDMKIDLFARDLFDALWRQHGLRTEPLKKSKRPPAKSEFDDNILRGVMARQAIFHSSYKVIFENLHPEILGSSRNFFYAIAERFPHYPRADLEDDMLMSTFLCSCAFVANMAMWFKSKDDDFLDVADKAWAMFADLYLKETFYEAGGWDDLHIFAEADLVLYDYVRKFSAIMDCKLGLNVLHHRASLTIAAIDSFKRFEAWPGVDDSDPMALEWVDYCVLEPYSRRIRPACCFRKATRKVFAELESTIYELRLICNPYYPEEGSDEATESVACSPRVDFDKESLPPDITTSSPLFGIDRGKVKEYDVSGSKAVKLRATDPEPIALTSEKPVHVVRLTAAEYAENIDGERNETSESRKSMTDEKGNKKESATDVERKDSIDDLEQSIVVEKLRSSSEGQTDSKVKTDSQSIPYNKNILPVSNGSFKSKTETDGVLKEKLPCSSSLGVSVTLLDPAEFNEANDSDEENMNRKLDDLNVFMKQFGLKEISDSVNPDSKSRLRYYAKIIDSDDIENTDGSLETPKSRLLTPRKSPLTSANVNVSIPLRKSPLTSTNVNVSSITDGALYKRKNNSTGSGARRGKRSTPKENFPSYESKDQKDKHPENDFFSFKNISHLKNKTDSSKQVKGQFLPDKDEGELKNLAKYSVKTYARTEQFKLDKKPNVLIDENSVSDNQKTSEHTIESSQIDQCAKDIEIPIPSEYPSKTSTWEGLNFSQNQLEDKVHEKSSLNLEMLTPMCLDVPHQNSIPTNDYEKDLEKSFKVFGPVETNDLSGPPIEKGSGLGNRQISQDSSSTEIYEITEGENSSAEPTIGNPFTFAEGTKYDANISLDCDKSVNTENETTTSAETTDENPFGFDGEKAKKSKQEANSNDSNLEALETSLNESTIAEPSLEVPFEVPLPPQDVEKKAKKKRTKRRLTRLEQRVKEEGNGVRDVMRLILVMGHQPSMASFASTLQDAERKNSEDENSEE